MLRRGAPETSDISELLSPQQRKHKFTQLKSGASMVRGHGRGRCRPDCDDAEAGGDRLAFALGEIWKTFLWANSRPSVDLLLLFLSNRKRRMFS